MSRSFGRKEAMREACDWKGYDSAVGGIPLGAKNRLMHGSASSRIIDQKLTGI